MCAGNPLAARTRAGCDDCNMLADALHLGMSGLPSSAVAQKLALSSS